MTIRSRRTESDPFRELHSTEDWAYSTSRLDTPWSCQIQSRETHRSDESSVSDVDDAVKRVHKNKSTSFKEHRFAYEDDTSTRASSIEIKDEPSHVCISIYTRDNPGNVRKKSDRDNEIQTEMDTLWVVGVSVWSVERTHVDPLRDKTLADSQRIVQIRFRNYRDELVE